MPKKIIIPSSIELIYNIKDKVDGFILGIKDLSVNLPYYFSIEEVSQLINNLDGKDIFINLNKNMYNSDLDLLENILVEISKLNVAGVIYYDVSVVNIKKRLNLDIDLVWGQEHMTTNYLTINYWSSFGAKYTLLSPDITLNEILEINKNTNSKLLMSIFGYMPMFTSYRHHVYNYLKTFNINDNSGSYIIEKEGKSYPIVDDNNGTSVYSSNILNGIEEYDKLNDIDYVVLNSYNIDDDKFETVIDLFNSVGESNKSIYYEQIKNMFGNVDKGFLFKETIYRVKNND